MVPRILVVLDLPRNEAEWLHVAPSELIMRRCANWAYIVGSAETKNKESVTIPIESRNRFDVAALQALMQRAKTGTMK